LQTETTEMKRNSSREELLPASEEESNESDSHWKRLWNCNHFWKIL